MMRVTWQTYGRKEIEKETMRYWFDKLIAYEFDVVTIAFDSWIKSQRELPTVKDITELCKPKVTIHARLPSPLAKTDHKQHVEELKEAVKKMIIQYSKYPCSVFISARINHFFNCFF